MLPPHLDLLSPAERPQTSHDRELAVIAARAAAARPPRQSFLARLALRRVFGKVSVTKSTITIREATDSDLAALGRLAQLDARRLTRGPALVAEVDERIVAGVVLESSEQIADPFRARPDVLQLLQLRAAQLAA